MYGSSRLMVSGHAQTSVQESAGGEILRWPAIFDPRRLHATTPCTIAFTPRNVNKLSVDEQLQLRTPGFHF